MIWLWCAAAVLVLVLVGAWCVWTATRLDRLQLRCEATEAALRAQLARRSSIAMELATEGLSDPASALALLDAAAAAGDVEGEAWIAQSELSQVLELVELPPPDDQPLVTPLMEAQRRASIARRIHNDCAASAVALRQRRRVRWFRLAGHSAPPSMIEFYDGTR